MDLKKPKKHLSAKGLLDAVKSTFDAIPSQSQASMGKQVRDSVISNTDCLMSGLAVFKLKYPSLLQFNLAFDEGTIRNNLEKLFGVNKAPSDTRMRERLDEMDPSDLRKAYKAVLAKAQRGKVLEDYAYLDGKYLLNCDGTGHFSSSKVHCENCCEKTLSNGQKNYYHQMMSCVICHPEQKEVFPLCPEPILKEDGIEKNDCERSASRRLLMNIRREHPHLPLIVVEDALFSNGPHIRLLKELDMSFIIGVKPSGNQKLFEWLKKVK